MSVRSTPAPASAGLSDSLRAMGATLAEILQVRGALFALELQEEIDRRRSMLLLAVAGGVLLHMALLLAIALVVVAFWETHRLAALATMLAVCLGTGALLLARLRHAIAASPVPFADTRSELTRDLAQVAGQP
jgi:uncharacterized membrane protein YqjE